MPQVALAYPKTAESSPQRSYRWVLLWPLCTLENNKESNQSVMLIETTGSANRTSGKEVCGRGDHCSWQSRRTEVPPNSSSQRGFHKVRSMADKPACPRHESRDLAGCVGYTQSDQTHESVCQQSTCRTCDREDFAGSEEESGSLCDVRLVSCSMTVKVAFRSRLGGGS
jgi:hypothetical protein